MGKDGVQDIYLFREVHTKCIVFNAFSSGDSRKKLKWWEFHELSNVLIKNSITQVRTHEYSHMHTLTPEGLHTTCCHM